MEKVLYHHAIQPTANPTLSSIYLLGKSMTGPLTGNKAVISPSEAKADHITDPIKR